MTREVILSGQKKKSLNFTSLLNAFDLRTEFAAHRYILQLLKDMCFHRYS